MQLCGSSEIDFSSEPTVAGTMVSDNNTTKDFNEDDSWYFYPVCGKICKLLQFRVLKVEKKDFWLSVIIKPETKIITLTSDKGHRLVCELIKTQSKYMLPV